VSSLELKTNLLAAYVSAGLSAQLPELMRQLGIKPRDSFEIAFNRCGLYCLPQGKQQHSQAMHC
jgi:signal recognition particle subunit SRP72